VDAGGLNVTWIDPEDIETALPTVWSVGYVVSVTDDALIYCGDWSDDLDVRHSVAIVPLVCVDETSVKILKKA
jgi:hypothetical protein